MFQRDLNSIAERLGNSLKRDVLVQKTLYDIREFLQADRIVLYYFYRQWKGQVTAESLRDQELSIFGSTGADDCFNDEYADLYQAGRYRAIADVEIEPIHECHRDFLISIQVKANLVVPVLVHQNLWGLLIAHHCQKPHYWSNSEIEFMQIQAQMLARSPVLVNQS
jgi:GAF domain-containing protein